MTKKNNSSAGISKRRGPAIASGGYVQMPLRIRYESQGSVAKKAISISVNVLYKSSFVRSGFKMKVRRQAGGIVYLRCLLNGLIQCSHKEKCSFVNASCGTYTRA